MIFIREPTFGEQSDEKINKDDVIPFDNESEQSQISDETSEDVQEHKEHSKKLEKIGSPLLFVDVNLGPTRTERIIVYDGDTAIQLAENFSKEHNLNALMKQKLVELLNMEISGILERIDEENSDNYSEGF